MTEKKYADNSIFYVMVISSISLLFFVTCLPEIIAQQLILNSSDVNEMALFNVTDFEQKNKVIINKVMGLNISKLPNFDPNENTAIYENKLLNIQIQYPQTWLLTTSGLSSPHDFVSFIPPLDNLSDTSQGRLIFSVAKFNQNISIESFKDISKRVNQDNTDPVGFQILKAENSSLIEHPAYTVLSLNNYNYPAQILELNSWVVINENILYSVSYVSQPDKFMKYKDDILKIMNSLKLID